MWSIHYLKKYETNNLMAEVIYDTIMSLKNRWCWAFLTLRRPWRACGQQEKWFSYYTLTWRHGFKGHMESIGMTCPCPLQSLFAVQLVIYITANHATLLISFIRRWYIIQSYRCFQTSNIDQCFAHFSFLPFLVDLWPPAILHYKPIENGITSFLRSLSSAYWSKNQFLFVRAMINIYATGSTDTSLVLLL